MRHTAIPGSDNRIAFVGTNRPPSAPPLPQWINWLLGSTFGAAFGGSFVAILACVLLFALGWVCATAVHKGAFPWRRRRGATDAMLYGTPSPTRGFRAVD